MARLLRDESLVALWQSFFEENCKSEIETIALEYPEKRSLIVDYWDIDKADPKLAELLINQPYKTLFRLNLRENHDPYQRKEDLSESPNRVLPDCLLGHLHLYQLYLD